MKSPFKIVAHHVVRPLLQTYLSKERTYRYQKITIRVLPGVFHPGFFFSTKILLGYLESISLQKKKVLELGAGSGLISFFAEQKGAMVTASDLSKKVIENLTINKSALRSAVTIVESNLFDRIPDQPFDIIIINPPYYAKQPTDEAMLAWYCGEHFEYFEKLFSQLGKFIHGQSKVFMILSEDCDVIQIQKMADAHAMSMKEIFRKKTWWEWNYIFEITSEATI
jgi:release factor glutamine methyltransferase